MATEKGKRETIFPGSYERTGVFGSKSSSASKLELLDSPTATNIRRTRHQTPLINLPVNPAAPYGDQLVPIKEGSPWRHYKNAYGLELGGPVSIVCTTPATSKLFAMHSISGPGREKMLYMLRQLKHENLLHPEEIFSLDDSFYVISEYAAVSLDGVVVVRPSEVQLAAIVHQARITLLHKAHSLTGMSDLRCHNLSQSA